jgi:hypothetical protein
VPTETTNAIMAESTMVKIACFINSKPLVKENLLYLSLLQGKIKIVIQATENKLLAC